MDNTEEFDFPEFDDIYHIVDEAFQGKADVPPELMDEVGDITDKAWEGGVNAPPDDSYDFEEDQEIKNLLATPFLDFCPDEVADLWEHYQELYIQYLQASDHAVATELNETYDAFKTELRYLGLI